MDSDNQAIIRSKMAQDHDFNEVWAELESRYVKDNLEHHRAHWRQLVLPLEGLNEDVVRKFRTEWEKRRSRVEDATEEEEHDLLLRRMGPMWANKILTEEEKRNSDKAAVKVYRFGDYTLPDLEDFVTRIAGETRTVLKRKMGGTPSCSTLKKPKEKSWT